VILLTVLDEVGKEGLQATSLVTTWRQPGCLYDLHAPQKIPSLSEVHCDLHDVKPGKKKHIVLQIQNGLYRNL
jgi:hypothetical protein